MATLYSLGAVTVDGYRVHTGDLTTAGTVVTGALVEAEELLDEALRRHLAWQERTDTLRIHPDGRVYPPAWPITDADLTIDGRALLGAAADETPFVGTFSTLTVNTATITWTGGFDDGTNSTRLPATLRHAVYDLAKALAQDHQPIPVGATSVSVGDVSISYGSGSSGDLDALVPGLWYRVKKYRNRFV